MQGVSSLRTAGYMIVPHWFTWETIPIEIPLGYLIFILCKIV